MNAGGVVLIIAGALVLFQVLGGNALGRLGLDGSDTSGDTSTPEFGNVPDKGYSNVPHDAQGRPL